MWQFVDEFECAAVLLKCYKFAQHFMRTIPTEIVVVQLSKQCLLLDVSRLLSYCCSLIQILALQHAWRMRGVLASDTMRYWHAGSWFGN